MHNFSLLLVNDMMVIPPIDQPETFIFFDVASTIFSLYNFPYKSRRFIYYATSIRNTIVACGASSR